MDSIRPLRNYNGGIVPQAVLNGTLGTVVYASNYNDLDNKPSINSVELRGNKTAEDLGLATPADITVTSVNTQTGDVSLTGQNIPYDGTYSVTEKINDLEAQITGSGVTSVNGKTGVVNLTGTDINYSAGVTLNAKIDAVENEIPEVNYPVTSVNGETGAVVLDGADIEYSGGVSVNSQIDTMMNYIPVYGNTASGAIATFDTSLALPLQDCTIEINAVQESGTPTPSSPKAISGFTGANIAVYNENLFTSMATSSNDGITTSYDNTTGLISIENNSRTTNYATGSTRAHVATGLNSSHTYKYEIIPNVTGVILIGGGAADLSKDGFTGYTTVDLRINKDYDFVNDHPIGSVTKVRLVLYDVTTGVLNTYPITWNDEVGTVSEGSLDVTTGKLTVVTGSMSAGTYQIIPISINQLSGTNNIFCDTGNTSVVFACSLKDYIEGQ